MQGWNEVEFAWQKSDNREKRHEKDGRWKGEKGSMREMEWINSGYRRGIKGKERSLLKRLPH